MTGNSSQSVGSFAGKAMPSVIAGLLVAVIVGQFQLSHQVTKNSVVLTQLRRDVDTNQTLLRERSALKPRVDDHDRRLTMLEKD